MDRKVNQKGELITIKSDVNEEVTPQEFMQVYNQKSQELYQLKDTVNQGRAQLKELDQVKETEELKELKEKLILAEKLKRRDEIKGQLREMEKRLETLEKELNQFTPMMKALNEQQSIPRKA